ncbi:hypothetical protein IQ264_08025 [Phormidium sp. LEGE 05292]|uniref:hypothetical protein n=1 Tax=[Phormidium] sp. LEGE 05292 TaxID=767427 RepID=UPI00187E07A9|nr:hypothetical protein [Phormidium sp. LEGE 05292]MBE9225377.1 hypothetical protein [Phormidium sp. LEGE 05292]
MVNPKKAAELIRKHFAEITTEQFLENLKRSSPELFEEDNENSENLPTEVKESNNEMAEESAKA